MKLNELNYIASNKYNEYKLYILNMELSELFWWSSAIIIFFMILIYCNTDKESKQYDF